MVSPDSRLATVEIYIQYIYITKIVVLVSEPVRGRSRATELPCCGIDFCTVYIYMYVNYLMFKLLFIPVDVHVYTILHVHLYSMNH